jgi:hypothetical protein
MRARAEREEAYRAAVEPRRPGRTKHDRRIAMRAILAGAALLMAWAGCAWAQQQRTVRLELPIACTPGVDCFIMNYVDHDDSPGRRDYQCRHLTYDGHNGTDFALADPGAMAIGVPVVAAAAGKAARIRDAMPDINMRDGGRDAVKGRECGNTVAIDHGNGWITEYCHLRQGSVAVRPGQRVETGQQLGLVGLSGATEFPHVHLRVGQGRKTVDPFVGLVEDIHTTCGLGAAPLWSKAALDQLAYRPVVIYLAGFVEGKPTVEDIRRQRIKAASVLNASSETISFYFQIIGLAKNDHVVRRLLGPDGRVVVERAGPAMTDLFSYIDFIGSKPRGRGFPPGVYRGEIVVTPGPGSDGQEIRRVETVEVR